MVTIDTNVLVRLIINDDPEQTQRALSVMEGGSVYIPVTVILEAEWVFRHCYSLSVPTVCRVFEKILSTPGVTVAEKAAVSQAVDLHEQDMDFADALHLCLSLGKSDVFYTLDKAFVKAAPDDGGIKVRRL